jgi:sugar phosphate isomerase/epimerase
LCLLEFTLNVTAPDWPEIDSLVQTSGALGFGLSFHAPYKGPYNPRGFSGRRRRELEELFAPVLEYAAAVGRTERPTPLVVHGAKGADARAALRRDTIAFLTWIQTQRANLCPVLELRVREEDTVKIGDSKADLMVTVSRWGTRRGGICWDLGHDARNAAETIPPGFIEHVRHVHVHDLSPHGKDHYPLVFEDDFTRHHLGDLCRAGYDRALILEVDGHIVTRLARERYTTSTRILRESLRRVAEPFYG